MIEMTERLRHERRTKMAADLEIEGEEMVANPERSNSEENPVC